MSRLDSTISDLEESAQDLDVFTELDLDPQSPKLADALFGSARQRTFDKVRASASRRDSPTLPWRNPSVRSKPNPAPTPQAQKQSVKRPDSPDINAILATTPRPRKSSTSVRPLSSRASQSKSLSPSQSTNTSSTGDSLSSDFGALLELDSDLENEDGGSESDSSLDIHTPLPHLMFRDGLLSPRSKLLPQTGLPSSSPYTYEEDELSLRSGSALSLTSTVGSAMTGLQRDPRNTARRRLRHRDNRLLRAGMGLTTGLGWSDSEDEDAPSPLTRRLIGTAIDRKRSASLMGPPRPNSQIAETNPSRFASPMPPSQMAPHSNLRSSSVSFPSKPSSSGITPRIPRGRATSTTIPSASSISSISRIASPPLGMVRLERERADSSASVTSSFSNRRFVASHAREEVVATPIAKARPQLPRSRTDSNASSSSISTALSSTAGHVNRSQSSLSKSISTPSLPRVPRSRAESTASTSTTTTTSHDTGISQYSQNSSSTTSSGSTVPRPLRLPQSAALKKSTSLSTSQEPSLSSTAAQYQRQRTLSNPQTSVRIPILPATASHGQVMTTSNSLASGVLPPGAPHTLRQKRSPSGSVPRPRTGTGMAYRTSSVSYASFHESGSKMRGLSLSTFDPKRIAA